jgi:hypothetical protein
VTGGRDFANKAALWSALDALHPDVVIQGGATGADALARRWGVAHGYMELDGNDPNARLSERIVITEPVTQQEWDMLSSFAGNARNQRMLKHRPTLVLACPGSSGTADMIQRALDARIPVVKLWGV